jgi:hypothetical protein
MTRRRRLDLRPERAEAEKNFPTPQNADSAEIIAATIFEGHRSHTLPGTLVMEAGGVTERTL